MNFMSISDKEFSPLFVQTNTFMLFQNKKHFIEEFDHFFGLTLKRNKFQGKTEKIYRKPFQ